MSDGSHSLPPRQGVGLAGESTPAAAWQWLDRWSGIGGGLTIGMDGRLCPWRIVPADTPLPVRMIRDNRQTEMLQQLDETPGLAAAIRVVLSTTAQRIVGRAINDIGKGKR